MTTTPTRIYGEPMLSSFNKYYDQYNRNTMYATSNMTISTKGSATYTVVNPDASSNELRLYDSFNRSGQCFFLYNPSCAFRVSGDLYWDHMKSEHQFVSLGWGDQNNRFSVTMYNQASSNILQISLNYRNEFGEQFRFLNVLYPSSNISQGSNYIQLLCSYEYNVMYLINDSCVFSAYIKDIVDPSPFLGSNSAIASNLGTYRYVPENLSYFEGMYSVIGSCGTALNNETDTRCTFENFFVENYDIYSNKCIFQQGVYAPYYYNLENQEPVVQLTRSMAGLSNYALYKIRQSQWSKSSDVISQFNIGTISIPSSSVPESSTIYNDSAVSLTYSFSNVGASAPGSAFLYDQKTTVTYFDSYDTSTGLYTGSEITNGIAGDWFQIEVSTPSQLVSYTQTVALGGYWTKWYIFASNDGLTWTQIDSKKITSLENNPATYFVSDTNLYRWFRYVINRTAAGAACIQNFQFNISPSTPVITNVLSPYISETITVPSTSTSVPSMVEHFYDVATSMSYTFASEGLSGSFSAGLFDKDSTTLTYFGSEILYYDTFTGEFSGISSTNGVLGAWFQIKLSTPSRLISYTQTAFNNYWLEWYIFGSVNGDTWNLIASENLPSWTVGNNPTTYLVTDNTTVYTYFRYVISKSAPGIFQPCMSDFKFHVSPTITLSVDSYTGLENQSVIQNLQSQVDAKVSSQWITSGSNIYYNNGGGGVLIGAVVPSNRALSSMLNVNGSATITGNTSITNGNLQIGRITLPTGTGYESLASYTEENFKLNIAYGKARVYSVEDTNHLVLSANTQLCGINFERTNGKDSAIKNDNSGNMNYIVNYGGKHVFQSGGWDLMTVDRFVSTNGGAELGLLNANGRCILGNTSGTALSYGGAYFYIHGDMDAVVPSSTHTISPFLNGQDNIACFVMVFVRNNGTAISTAKCGCAMVSFTKRTGLSALERVTVVHSNKTGTLVTLSFAASGNNLVVTTDSDCKVTWQLFGGC